MDDAKFGSAVRAVRIRSKLTQTQVATAASVRRFEVSCLEQGKFNHMSIGRLRRIVAASGMWVDLKPNWKGVNLDRLVNGAHAALQEAVLAYLAGLDGWVAKAEVSFAIGKERGIIDILAWHAASRTLLIIELKTLLVDPAELVAKTGQRTRLAATIAATLGWHPQHVATWVIFTDTRTNRRQVAGHRELLKGLAQLDGRRIRTWLRSPDGPIAALSFWAEPKAFIRQHVRTKAGSGGAAASGAA